MKRHIQKTGVRKFFGQDFIDLQAEPLRALDTFFAEYGACVIQGCELSVNGDGTYDVAAGLVAIEAGEVGEVGEVGDPETGDTSIKVMPFDGATGVSLPLYLTAVGVVDERVYGDGRVKPIAVDFRAVASGVEPLGAHIVLSEAVSNRFVDVLQDDTHTFVSAAERARWNDILRLAKEYAGLQAEAVKRSAIEYTDATTVALRDELALGDQAALRSAKSYADQIVAALVDGSPELLNTLEELAGALGNDPNFATTVMTEIGKRVKISDFEAHSHTALGVGALPLGAYDLTTNNPEEYPLGQFYLSGDGINGQAVCVSSKAGLGSSGTKFVLVVDRTSGNAYLRHRNGNTNEWSPFVKLFHSGNFKPEEKADRVELDKKADANHSHTALGVGALPLGAYDLTINNPEEYPLGQFYLSGDGINGQAVCVSSKTGLGSSGTKFVLVVDRTSGNAYLRHRNGSTGAWSPFQLLYTNGNLTRATDAADGLMAATDKGKLDAINDYQLLAAYWIAADGTIMRSFGSRVSGDVPVRLSQGKIRIYHRARMNYIATVTPYGLESGGGRSVFTASIIAQRDNYTDIATADGTNGNLYNAAFNLTIHGHYLTPIF